MRSARARVRPRSPLVGREPTSVMTLMDGVCVGHKLQACGRVCAAGTHRRARVGAQTVRARVPARLATRSMSWHDLAMKEQHEWRELAQLPRTYEWAQCQCPTGSTWSIIWGMSECAAH